MNIEEKIEKYLNEKRQMYWIEVSVSDAKKAGELMRDDPNRSYKMSGTNVFIFPDADEYLAAIEEFEEAKIEIDKYSIDPDEVD